MAVLTFNLYSSSLLTIQKVCPPVFELTENIALTQYRRQPLEATLEAAQFFYTAHAGHLL